MGFHVALADSGTPVQLIELALQAQMLGFDVQTMRSACPGTCGQAAATATPASSIATRAVTTATCSSRPRRSARCSPLHCSDCTPIRRHYCRSTPSTPHATSSPKWRAKPADDLFARVAPPNWLRYQETGPRRRSVGGRPARSSRRLPKYVPRQRHIGASEHRRRRTRPQSPGRPPTRLGARRTGGENGVGHRTRSEFLTVSGLCATAVVDAVMRRLLSAQSGRLPDATYL